MKLIVFVLLLIEILAEDTTDTNNRMGLKRTRKKHNKGNVAELLAQLKQGIDLCNSRYEETHQGAASVVNDSSIFDVRIDSLPARCRPYKVEKNCAAATACLQRSGIYEIRVDMYSREPFLVECDAKTEGGGWILIQRRQDGSELFNRNWNDYKNGFGHVDGEFFVGLDKLHVLTNFNGPQELLVLLKDKNETRKAFYSNFVIGNDTESYALKRLGTFSGDAGNSLLPHLGAKFSTVDQYNKVAGEDCGQAYSGGWWFKPCHNSSNLNGNYGDEKMETGISWPTFQGHNGPLQQVTMMIRRRLS